ncbi:hypothetical protein VNO77_12953 [Canavalia gladiata]|uniref:Uncharacterized protein n=1 Tax=Canavalia gladiata TaxID=3824 RepID=A0AAN9QRC8_CANGL
MSSIFLSKFFFLLILLFNHGANTPICVAAARPLEQNDPKYINLKPQKVDGRKGFQGSGNIVEACLPKGFRASSAPSRYINYEPLGSTCSSDKELFTVMKQEEKGFCNEYICGPFGSFRRRCNRLVKEHRARFYILRRCVTMLVCWHDCDDA